MKAIVFMLVLPTALGAAAIATTISFVEQANAKSCQNHGRGAGDCHGCAFDSIGYDKSEDKCFHFDD